MNSELESIPGLATLTTRRLAGGDFEVFRRKTDWPLHLETLGLSALKELATDLLERLDIATGEGDSDAVNFRLLAELLLVLLMRHSDDRQDSALIGAAVT